MSWRRPHGHRSLGLRLVALFVLLAVVLGTVVMVGMERMLRFGYSGVVQPLLADYVDRLAAEIGSPPNLAAAQALEARLPVRVRIDGPLVRYGGHGDGPYHGGDAGEAGDRRRGADWGDAAPSRLVARRTADGHLLTFGIAPEVWHERPRAVGWAMLVLLLVALALAFHAVRRLFRPIDDIAAGALRYGQGDFATPIPVRRRDELGVLAGQVNHMAGELRRMLDSKRELLLAISHELRSPLTRARLNAELLGDVAAGRAAADAPAGDAVPALPERDALLRDLEEMRRLIEQLLEHERLAQGHRALHRRPCDVAALVRQWLASSFDGVPVELDLAPDLGEVALDAARVELALRNLLSNALRHGGGAAGPPRLRVRRDGPRLVFTVRDLGPGVAPEHLARLAEPFYRPDAARGRDAGGVGLGLALARMVAEAHGGQLRLRNAQPGLEATLALPVGA